LLQTETLHVGKDLANGCGVPGTYSELNCAQQSLGPTGRFGVLAQCGREFSTREWKIVLCQALRACQEHIEGLHFALCSEALEHGLWFAGI